MRARRLVGIVAACALTLGAVAWSAGSGVAGTDTPGSQESTTTSTTALPDAAVTPAPTPSDVGATAAPVGPVGYTNGADFRGPGIECNFFQVDLPTGILTRKNASPLPCADGYTFSSTGVLYAFTAQPLNGSPAMKLVTVDPATGAQTTVGALPAVLSGGMTFDSAGNLWLYAAVADRQVCGFDFCLWKVDPATAASKLVGGQNTRFVDGLAATCTQVLATTDPSVAGSPAGNLALLDTTSAGLTTTASLPARVFLSGLDYDAAGVLWGVGSQPTTGFQGSSSFRVDPATGAVTGARLTENGQDINFPVFGLAVAGLSCVVAAPSFTG